MKSEWIPFQIQIQLTYHVQTLNIGAFSVSSTAKRPVLPQMFTK
jgi:hypothetical protein